MTARRTQAASTPRYLKPLRLAAALGPLAVAACGAPPAAPDAAAVEDVAVKPDVATAGDVATAPPDASPDVAAPDAPPAPDAAAPDVPAADAPADVATSADAATVDPSLLGTFHFGTDAELNLVIEPGGTFRWHRSDCASTTGACGRWRLDGRDLVLTGSVAGGEFGWVVGSLQETVVTARVSAGTGADDVVIRGMGGGRAPRAFEQTWARGRVCVTCAGTRPAGAATACTTAVPDACR